jgi:hypothetical protein
MSSQDHDVTTLLSGNVRNCHTIFTRCGHSAFWRSQMAIRKSVEEALVVAGERDEWLARCTKGLITAGFKDVQTSTVLGQVTGTYKNFPTYGELTITAVPSTQSGNTQLTLRSTAAVDNLYALFSSPNKKILATAKASLA